MRHLTDGELDIIREQNEDAYPSSWCIVCEDEPTDACAHHTTAEIEEAQDRAYQEQMSYVDHKGFGFSI